MPSITVNDQQIYFEDTGSQSSVPILLGHSFLCDGTMWRDQVSALEPHYRMINVDFRGHGRSGAVEGPFTLYDAVEDMVAVLDHLGISHAIWCGLSIGGMVAMRAALEFPDRVSALVIMDSSASMETRYKRLRYSIMGWAARYVGIKPFLSTISGLMFGQTTLKDNMALVREWREIFCRIDVPSALHGLDALKSRDSVLERLSEVHVPTLILVGEEDKSLPVMHSKCMHAKIPLSELGIIREAGHLSAMEQHEQVNLALKSFLSRL
jgi:pimeloyl-ACP methyl ester carboxylesterase